MLASSRLYNYLYIIKVNLRDYLSIFFSFLHVKLYLIILFLANLSIWLLTYYINRQVSQDLVILHYNVNFGVNLIGSVKQLYIIPSLGTVIVLFNSLISLIFSRQNNFRFLSHILFAAALLTHFFLLTALAALYLINFR